MKGQGKTPSKKSGKETSSIVVEFLGEWCKLIVLDGTQGKWAIRSCEIIDLPKGETQPLKERLASFKNKDNPPEAILILPRPQVIFREIKIPSVDLTEIRQMVDLQVDNLNPNLSRADLVYGYLSRKADEGVSSSVLLHLVKKELVRDWILLLKNAGFVVTHVFLSSEALSKLTAEWLKQSKQDGAVGIIDVDRFGTEVTVLDAVNTGEILFSRAINLGAKDLVEQKITVERFVEDLFFTLMAYQRGKIGPEVKRLVLTGSSVEPMAQLAAQLGERFSMAVGQVPLTELVSHGAAIEGIARISNADASLTPLLGGAIYQKEFKMEFFPDEIRVQEARKKLKKSLIFSAILVGMILVVWGLIIAAWLRKDQYIVNGLMAATKEMKPVAIQLQDQKKRLEAAKGLVAKRITALETLRLLREKAPKDVFLASFEYDANSLKVNIQGISQSLTTAFNYVSALKGTSAFSDVNLKYANKKKSEQGDVSDFRIEMKLVPGKLHAKE